MITAEESAANWIAEGASITRVVFIGDEDAALLMVRNVFDAEEFVRALKKMALLEADYLLYKQSRSYCCENGESLGLNGECCSSCGSISDGYFEAMTPPNA